MSKTLSRAGMRMAADIVRAVKLRNEHRWHDPADCDVAEGFRAHCVHGTYVGTWDGPDYMCHYCETGTSVYDFALGQAYERQRRMEKDVRERMMRAAIDAMGADGDAAAWLSTATVGELGSLVFAMVKPDMR